LVNSTHIRKHYTYMGMFISPGTGPLKTTLNKSVFLDSNTTMNLNKPQTLGK